MRQTPALFILATLTSFINVNGFGRSSGHAKPILSVRLSQRPAPSLLWVTQQEQSYDSSLDNYVGGNVDAIDPAHNTRTALSMPLEELSEILGGRGRARLAWDCYSKGVDPHYLFSPESPSLDQYPVISPYNWNEYSDKEHLKRQALPTQRRTQPLGNSALSLLSNLHSHCNGRIENGLATLVHVSTSSDGTTKLLLRLIDGWEVETVLIPFWSDGTHKNNIKNKANGKQNDGNNEIISVGRTTVCISSQVGCRQGCTFCATGKMGKLRSLTTDEILSQLFFAKKMVRLSHDGTLRTDQNGQSVTLPPISNIVFMGMGEPSDNSAAVCGAIDIMTQNDYFQLSASRVTVSTVAPSPKAFSDFVDSRCVLAWSVHAVRNDLRKQLVPTTKYTMEELRDGLIDTLKNRSLRTCMIEVALMDKVNDSLREADELAEFLSYITKEVPRSKLICNLIPFNDIGGAGGTTFRKPSMERVLAFRKRLQSLGICAHVRGTRGDDESAACGQLVTSRKKKEMEAV